MKLLNYLSLAVCLLFAVNTAAQIRFCHPKDSAALIQLRDATNNNGWNTLTNLGGGPIWGALLAEPHDWFGIDTIHDPYNTAYYRIFNINLDSYNFNPVGTKYLSGTLPGGLFNDSALYYLDTLRLTGNELTGCTQALKNNNTALSPAPHLKYIDVGFNLFDPTDPNMFGFLMANMARLRTLQADYAVNTAQTALAFSSYNFPNLPLFEMLFMNGNNLQGTLDIDFLTGNGVFPMLFKIHADDNLFTNLKAVSNPFNSPLYVLSMHGNLLQDFIDVKNLISNYDSLSYLYGSGIMDPNISDTLDLGIIGQRPFLFHIELPDNNLIGTLPVELFENFPNIWVIRLHNNNLSGAFPVPVSTFTFGGNTIRAYDGLHDLRELNLGNNNLQGKIRLDWLFADQLKFNQPSNGNNMYFEFLDLSDNNFNEVMPRLDNTSANEILSTTFSQRFPITYGVHVHGNALDFRDLFRVKNIFRMKQVSILLKDHYIPQLGLDDNDFTYAPQDSIGIGGIRRRPPGEDLVIDAGRPPVEPRAGATFSVLKNKYTWERVSPVGVFNNIGSVLPNGTFSGPGGTGYLPADGELGDSTFRHKLGIRDLIPLIHDNQRYTACVSNDSFPNLTICLKQKKVEVGYCYDSSGTQIQCQTMIVQFKPSALSGLTPAQQDSVKAESAESIGATPIDECLCGDMELWEISDTSSTMVEGFGSGTKRSTSSASAKPELLSADPNYELSDADTSSVPDSLAMSQGEGNTTAKTLVAIIDSGVDYEYTALKPFISEGAATGDTCMPNAYWGYNFLAENNIASDDNGHGTAVAGIITGLSQNNLLPDTGQYANEIAILPLKYTDKNGQGTLFHAACALRYAADYRRVLSSGDTARVRVVNNSWGYYGDPCMVLENTIQYAAEDCGILLVNSAGNDGTIVEGADSLRHWPSNSIWDPMDTISADNILSVAAVSSHTGDVLPSYSNYGPTHIDLAAQGTDLSTQAGTTNGFGAVNGTSFASAQVSRAAALLFDKYPQATYFAVKHALMNGVDKLQSSDSTKLVSKGRLNYHKADSILNIIINKNNCSPNFILDNITTINQEDDLVQVYPNPVQHALTVELDARLWKSASDGVLIISNIQGQVVYRSNIQNGSLQKNVLSSEFNTGMYLLHINIDGKHIVRKIFKL